MEPASKPPVSQAAPQTPFATVWSKPVNAQDKATTQLMLKNLDIIGTVQGAKLSYYDTGHVEARWSNVVPLHYGSSLEIENIKVFSEHTKNLCKELALDPKESAVALAKLDQAIKNIDNIKKLYVGQPAKEALWEEVKNDLTAARTSINLNQQAAEGLTKEFGNTHSAGLLTHFREEFKDGFNEETVFATIHQMGIVQPSTKETPETIPLAQPLNIEGTLDNVHQLIGNLKYPKEEGEKIYSAILIQQFRLEQNVAEATKFLAKVEDEFTPGIKEAKADVEAKKEGSAEELAAAKENLANLEKDYNTWKDEQTQKLNEAKNAVDGFKVKLDELLKPHRGKILLDAQGKFNAAFIKLADVAQIKAELSAPKAKPAPMSDALALRNTELTLAAPVDPAAEKERARREEVGKVALTGAFFGAGLVAAATAGVIMAPAAAAFITGAAVTALVTGAPVFGAALHHAAKGETGGAELMTDALMAKVLPGAPGRKPIAPLQGFGSGPTVTELPDEPTTLAKQ